MRPTMNFAQKALVMMLLTLVSMCGFTSCQDDDDWDEEVLTGKWWSVDDPYNVICLDFYRDHCGLCSEEDLYYGYYYEDPFTWFVDAQLIHIIFQDGSKWIWNYNLYNGHTVRINGRLFSRDPHYRSRPYVPSPSTTTEKPD